MDWNEPGTNGTKPLILTRLPTACSSIYIICWHRLNRVLLIDCLYGVSFVIEYFTSWSIPYISSGVSHILIFWRRFNTSFKCNLLFLVPDRAILIGVVVETTFFSVQTHRTLPGSWHLRTYAIGLFLEVCSRVKGFGRVSQLYFLTVKPRWCPCRRWTWQASG